MECFPKSDKTLFDVYGYFAGILFGSSRDLKIRYISFWWPGAKLKGDQAWGLGQQ